MSHVMQWTQELIDKEGIRFYAQIKLQFFYDQNGLIKWVVFCMDHLCPDNGPSLMGLPAEAATDKDSCHDDSPRVMDHHHDNDQDYSCQTRCEEKQHQPYLTSVTATRAAARSFHGSLRVQSLPAHSQGLETTLQSASPSTAAFLQELRSSDTFDSLSSATSRQQQQQHASSPSTAAFLQELQTPETFESLSSAISMDYSRQQQQHTSSSSSSSAIDPSEEPSEMWIERVMHEAMSNPLESSVGGGAEAAAAVMSPLFSAWMDSHQSPVECDIVGNGVGGGVDKMEDPFRGMIEKRRNEEGEEGGGLECMSLFYGGGSSTSAFGVHL